MKKKVLLVSCDGLGNGGVQNVMMNLVRNMKNQYHFDVLLFTNEKRYYDDEFAKYGEIYRIPNNKNKLDFYFRFFRILKKTYKILKKNEYDVIHCHNHTESGICIFAAKLAGVKVRISHTHINSELKPNPLRAIYNKIYVFLINHYSTHKIGCSQIAGQTLFGHNESFDVIVNPIDLNRFDRSLYPKKSTETVNFIHVGQFSDIKNQLFLLDVFSEIKKSISNAKLILIGFGDLYKRKIEEKIKNLNLENDVEILFSDSNVPSNLAQSDYMIFPSKREGLGIALLEAQAMGLKCFVSSAVPKEADAGLCEFYDLEIGSELWASKIVNFINQDAQDKKADMSKFDMKYICKMYSEIYNDGSKVQ